MSELPTATGELLEAVAELLLTLLQTVTELFSQALTTLNLLPSLIPAAVEAVMMTAWVENADGNALRKGLPYLSELNFFLLEVGDNTIIVVENNAALTSLEIQAKSRWR